MSACADARQRLAPYVADGLEPAAAAEVRAHLERCPPCRAAAAGEAGLQAALRRVVAAPPAALDAAGRLARARARLAAEGADPPGGRPEDPPAEVPPPLTALPGGGRRLRPRLQALVAAAALLAAVLGGFYAFAPPCYRGDCPTRDLLRAAAAAPPSADEGPGPRVDVALPDVRRVGATAVAGPRGPIPATRYARGASELIVFEPPHAHVHLWQVDRLADGRPYVVLREGPRHVVGWVDDAARVWCCVSPDADEAVALATSLRGRS